MRNKPKIHYAWLIMLSCCFMLAGVNGIYGYCAGIFFRPVATELGVGQGDISLYVTFQALASALAMPLVTRIIRKVDIRLLISGSVLIGASMFGLMSTFTRVYQWYIAGAILGFGCGYIYSLPVPILINNWFQEKASLAMGIASMCSGLGGAIISPIGTMIIAHYHWRAAYVALALTSLGLVLPFSIFVLRFQPKDLGLKPYGAEAKPKTQPSAMQGVQAGIPAAVALRSGTYLFLVFTAACIGFMDKFVQHIPSFIGFLGFAPAQIAALSSCMMLGTVGAKPLLGWLIDRFGAKRGVLCALTGLGLSFTLMILANQVLPGLFIALLLFGFGPALSIVGSPQLTRDLFGTRDFPTLYTYISMVVMLVGAGSVSCVGYLFDAFGSYNPAFTLAILAAILAAVFVLVAFSGAERIKQQVGASHGSGFSG
jgi:MFS family permease